MIPFRLQEPWSGTHPDREMIRKAAVEGFPTRDTARLTAAFSGLPEEEKQNAFEYLQCGHDVVCVEFSKWVYEACGTSLLKMFGIMLDGSWGIPTIKVVARNPKWVL